MAGLEEDVVRREALRILVTEHVLGLLALRCSTTLGCPMRGPNI